MQYVDFGKTGETVSRLGMGCMRLPQRQVNGKTEYDREASVALIRRAVELGITYFDTAPGYCDQLSEGILGEAIKDCRDKLFISTKYPLEEASGDDYDRKLESSLKKLGTDHIDFFHFWGISLDAFINKVVTKDGPLDRARKAKEQGLIRHISFSFHDRESGDEEPAKLEEILKRGEGVLESMLCQYNLLDRNKGPGIELAHRMGLGTAVMGPVGGGRLGAPSEVIQSLLPHRATSTAEMALRFVWANPAVNVALSGMSTIEQLEENCRIVDNTAPLSAEELVRIEAMMKENERLAGLYCTGCKYCMPCPQGIDIPAVFTIMNYHRVYKLTEMAKREYAEIGTNEWKNYKNAAACVKCGICETKCPQSLPIRKQLEETHRVLAAK
jgi:predicted aldo/keto reductase-like oxidoreductase